MQDFKPMLSATVDDVNKLRFPLLASPKLDGIRALVRDGVLVSRNLKPIPNKHVQAMFGRKELESFDGELIMGSPTDPAAFRNTTSAVMAHEGTPDVVFYVFDLCRTVPERSPQSFAERLRDLQRLAKKIKGVQLVVQTEVTCVRDVDVFEARCLDEGHEGIMLRSADAVYKQGRSTFKEHGLMKLKRFEDAEAKIVGFEEQMHNANEAKTSLTGHKERSSKKAGMIGKDTLGALKVVGVNGTYKGVEFNIGTGFDDAQRAEIWASQKMWLGKVVKFKFFPTGSKTAPRFPVFLGERSSNDR